MFFDDQDQPVRMVGFTADVTSRKLVEEELRRSEVAVYGRLRMMVREQDFLFQFHAKLSEWRSCYEERG
jgi:hypothetical protein